MLQKYYRGRASRRYFRYLRELYRAKMATKIQKTIRGWLSKCKSTRLWKVVRYYKQEIKKVILVLDMFY